MTLTVMPDLKAAPTRRRLEAQPSLARRRPGLWAATLSACAHSGTRRAARLSSGTNGGAPGAPRWRCAAAVGGSWRPLPRFGLGGPTLLTEDRQKPTRVLDAMHGTRN